jgi:hypothetical protein
MSYGVTRPRTRYILSYSKTGLAGDLLVFRA